MGVSITYIEESSSNILKSIILELSLLKRETEYTYYFRAGLNGKLQYRKIFKMVKFDSKLTRINFEIDFFPVS